jgi:hypothetical protein
MVEARLVDDPVVHAPPALMPLDPFDEPSAHLVRAGQPFSGHVHPRPLAKIEALKRRLGSNRWRARGKEAGLDERHEV